MRVPLAPVLVTALVVVPLVELYVLLQVGAAIGTPWTLALLVADALLGGYLLRREGRRTWAAFRSASTRGSVPTSEVADGALVLLGGTLMLTPGFVTDAFGLLCVLPPSRTVLRRALLSYGARRVLHGRPAGPGRVVDHDA
ncbi:MAG: FxsA cytoplasmic rane protein [Frankiales bacterium]|nr:FxsA cytoplasmic rane protein [Frankiales bacterium]